MRVQIADTKNEKTGYTVEMEEWWAGPDQWRRGIKSQAFSQTAIQNGQHYFETNSADYLPWWLNDLMTELVDPIPVRELEEVKAEFVDQDGRRCARWSTEFTNGAQSKTAGNTICLHAEDAAPDFVGTRTAVADFSDYHPFGSKQIARLLAIWPEYRVEVKAKVTLLEPLEADPSLFKIERDTGFKSRLRTETVAETVVRAGLLKAPAISWPKVNNFPEQGLTMVTIDVDRTGRVREAKPLVSDNPAVDEAAVAQVKLWEFKPFLLDGAPVQVHATLTLPFATKVQVSDAETSPAMPALKRLERARQLSDLRADGSKPFHLHATFQAGGDVELRGNGVYDEIWESPTKWRREATLTGIRVIEARDGQNLYRKIHGSDFSPRRIDDLLDAMAGRLVGTESFHEADWRQGMVKFGGVDLLRVLRGYESPEGELDPVHATAYWLDPATGLLRADYQMSTTATYNGFKEWNGKQVPRRIDMTENDTKSLQIEIDRIEEAANVPDSTFVVEHTKPERHMDPDDYEGPVIVPAHPILEFKPAHPPAGHGVTVLDVDLTSTVTFETLPSGRAPEKS